MPSNQGVTPSGSGYSPKGGAAKASPAKPSIPNAGNWIEWGGGKCPVPDDTRVDVRWDNRAISYNTPAGIYGGNGEGPDLWGGPQSGGFIVAYRVAASQSPPDFYTGSIGLQVEVSGIGSSSGLLQLTSPTMPRFSLVGRSVEELLQEAPIVIAAMINEFQAPRSTRGLVCSECGLLAPDARGPCACGCNKFRLSQDRNPKGEKPQALSS